MWIKIGGTLLLIFLGIQIVRKIRFEKDKIIVTDKWITIAHSNGRKVIPMRDVLSIESTTSLVIGLKNGK